MPDYSVEYLDAGEGTILEDIIRNKRSLRQALYQIIHDLEMNQDLVEVCGLNLREVDDSD